MVCVGWGRYLGGVVGVVLTPRRRQVLQVMGCEPDRWWLAKELFWDSEAARECCRLLVGHGVLEEQRSSVHPFRMSWRLTPFGRTLAGE